MHAVGALRTSRSGRRRRRAKYVGRPSARTTTRSSSSPMRRRAHPHRAVLFVGEPESAQRSIPASTLPAVVQRFSLCQRSKRDAETRRRRPAVRATIASRANVRETRQPLGFAARAPALAVALAQALGDRDQVVAGIAVLGEGKVRFPELPVARVERTAERVHLRAGIVDDPLGETSSPMKRNAARERVADRERAALHDDERPGRIRAAVFERDVLARRRRRGRKRRLRAGSARRRAASRRPPDAR